MARIKSEDILGYYVGEELICSKCITDEELSEVKQDDILTEQDANNSDDMFFCDRCKKKIYGL